MIVTNTETIPGKTIVQLLGIVSGNTVRAKHFGHDLMEGLKNLVGGELISYTELLQESREQAMQRMIAHAQELEADAVVNVRFATSTLALRASELYVYGTAVKLVDTPGSGS